jgi:hypothetical protein
MVRAIIVHTRTVAFSTAFSSWAYFKSMRIRAVGTEQITPPLPKQKKGPLAGPFFVFAIDAGLGSAKQVHSEAGKAGRHN